MRTAAILALSRRRAADARCQQRLLAVLAPRPRADRGRSDRGFCYSIEFLVKAHRLVWRIGEVPALWFERTSGASRFRAMKWLPAYLRWFLYAFATTFLRRSPRSVRMMLDRARPVS